MSQHTFVVTIGEAGQTVAAVLRKHLKVSFQAARQMVQQRRVQLAGSPCLDAERPVSPGQRIAVVAPPREKPRQSDHAAPVIRFVDEHIVVVDKPPDLTTMRHADEAAEFGRGRRFLPSTLADLLPALLARDMGKQPRVRAVHRLDKETSGLVVFARTAAAESHLGRQFRAHSIERRYLALVRGKAKAGTIESLLVRDRGDGRRGSGAADGQRAVTHVQVIEELGSFTLVECRLETGRTHQVRIHLGEASTPLCGERVYDRPLHGKPLPDASGASRPMLHAALLGIAHPATGQRMTWEAPLPADMSALLGRLRKRTRKK